MMLGEELCKKPRFKKFIAEIVFLSTYYIRQRGKPFQSIMIKKLNFRSLIATSVSEEGIQN